MVDRKDDLSETNPKNTIKIILRSAGGISKDRQKVKEG
jgi:hypothetical protein